MKKAINQVTLFAFLAAFFFLIYEANIDVTRKDIKYFLSTNGEEVNGSYERTDNNDNKEMFIENNDISYSVNNSDIPNSNYESNVLVESSPVTQATANFDNAQQENYNTASIGNSEVNNNDVASNNYNPRSDDETSTLNNNFSNTAPYENAAESYNSSKYKGRGMSSLDVESPPPSAGTPPPPGGGNDPFNTPLDDYYGLILLGLLASFLGIKKVRKMKISLAQSYKKK